MKLNNKGFTLIELLAVMVILVTILTIAIPSITASLSRSEAKQLQAQKDSIAATALINIKRSDFIDSNEYANFNRKKSTCVLTVEQLVALGYIPESLAKDKKGNQIEGCVGYRSYDLVFISPCNIEECKVQP